MRYIIKSLRLYSNYARSENKDTTQGEKATDKDIKGKRKVDRDTGRGERSNRVVKLDIGF